MSTGFPDGLASETITDMAGKIVETSRELMAATRRFCDGRGADWLLGAWSFAEALVWFILPDFLLLPYAAAAPRKSKRWFITALCSSLAGTLLLLILAVFWPEPVRQMIFSLPFTAAAMLSELEGIRAPEILTQSVSGIPAKVWTLAALDYHWNLAAFLLLLTLSRGLRMAAVLLIGQWLSGRRWVEDYWLLWLILYIPAFLAGLSAVSNGG